MGRTALLYLVPAALLVTGWATLEEPGTAAMRTGAVLAVLALLPALVRPLWARAGAVVGAAVAALAFAFDVVPTDARPFDGEHDYFGPLLSRAREGFLAYYDVSVPFASAQRPLMHGVVLVAIFAFCLALALAIAARRPLFASLVLLVGAAWPVTLVGDDTLRRGGVVLAVVLSLLAAAGRSRPRTLRPALLAGAAIVVVSLGGATSPAVAKGEFVAWKQWDFYDKPDDPVSVRYVWNARYGGIAFPAKRTTVMTVEGPRTPLYWRATTLDEFDDDRWLERLDTVAIDPRSLVVRDALLPDRARDRRRWTEARVTIKALRDTRLPAPSIPVAYDVTELGQTELRAGGVASFAPGLERDDRYRVWAHAASPSPRELARARPPSGRTSALVSPYLELAPGAPTLPLGTAAARDRLRNLLADERLARYEPLYDIARDVVGDARNMYTATVRLEAWFRGRGGFRYDEQPRLAFGTPPLVSFVTRFREGYCQQFAGAMALMLRLVGVPARVAVGFTSGTYDSLEGRWTVTDHDAHAWVEVWFDGWGWLPFDPTPGRGRLPGTYSSAAAQNGAPGSGATLPLDLSQRGGVAEEAPSRDIPGDLPTAGVSATERGGSLLRLLALLGLVVAAAIVAAKLVRRARRRLARDPRRVAAACRADLADFLADQRLSVPRSATFDEVADVIEERLRINARPFARAAEAARFAPAAEATAAAGRTRRELRALRARMRDRLTPLERARGLFSVRSLGLDA